MWRSALIMTLAGCTIVDEFTLLTLSDERALGEEFHAEILSDPRTYPIVDRDEFPDAYDHLERIRDTVLDSGEVEHRDDFDWPIFLIDDDETLNAFATPGGYVYLYTGLIEYLDHEDHLAGVVGHEIAHADRRHSGKQLTKAYGVYALLGVVLGEDPGVVADMAAGLLSLEFSRDDESEADAYSVIYLCETHYAADGAAGFFDKLDSEGGIDIPAFLSTHPSSDNRVTEITDEATAQGCSRDLSSDAQWTDLLNSLP